MPIGNSGAALFAGSCQQFVEMTPVSTLTAHLVKEFNRRWGTVTASEELLGNGVSPRSPALPTNHRWCGQASVLSCGYR